MSRTTFFSVTGAFAAIVAVVLMFSSEFLLYIPTHGRSKNTLLGWHNAVVRVSHTDGFGTGTEGTYCGKRVVLTAAHVVRHSPRIDVVFEAEGYSVTRQARVLGSSQQDDLAVLETDAPGPSLGLLPDLTPVDDDLVLGEDAFYSGFGADARNWLERAVVARPRWKLDEYDGFIVTGKGWYGSSGSAVLVMRNGEPRLAGVYCCSAASRSSGDCHPFAPGGCQGPERLRRFLDRYLRYLR